MMRKIRPNKKRKEKIILTERKRARTKSESGSEKTTFAKHLSSTHREHVSEVTKVENDEEKKYYKRKQQKQLTREYIQTSNGR